MKYPNNFQLNTYLTLLLFFLLSFSMHAQKNNAIWEALLKNDRQEAMKLIKKLRTKDDIENAILKKIVETENGMLSTDLEFIKNVKDYKDFEYYLFAHWMKPFVFGDYLGNGFNNLSCEVPLIIDPETISNTTVANGLYYLQSIIKRYKNDWNQYGELMDKIPTIQSWEYCGVFENLNSSGIDMPYHPEEEALTGVVFDAQSKGEASWYTPGYNAEVYNFFENHSEYGSGVHYAQTFIVSDKDQRVHLKIGKGGLLRVWLNDVLVMDEDERYITELDAYTYAVNLQKGVNRILVKSASSGSTTYFIARLEDQNGQPFTDYKVSFENRAYTKGTNESVDPKPISHSIETYFENKISDVSTDVNLTRLSLYLTYYRNGRAKKALNMMKKWVEKYPKSSFLKSYLIDCYATLGEKNTVDKLKNNIKRRDPDYYLSCLLEYEDFNSLQKLDLQTYISKLNKIKSIVDVSYLKTTVDLLIALREKNLELTKEKLNQLLEDKSLPSSIQAKFAEFNSRLFSDDNKTIEILEKLKKEKYEWNIIGNLAYYYKKQNRIEDVLELYMESLKQFDTDNNLHYKIIKLLHDTGQFERSLPFIDQAIANFPNTYVFTKLKGNAYVQLKKKKEAIKLYELALSRFPADRNLRASINDLKKKTNPLDDFHIEKAYDYIDDNRKIITSNNYGVNILLDQTDVLYHKNGGGEYKATLIYEITSQNGIDIFKEYNLGLSGDYLIHNSEIVKPNGDIVPAEKSGSRLVFDELEVGDVIYLDYENRFTQSGRFYKDYILSDNFGGYHPVIKKTYRLLTVDKNVNHKITSGTLDYKTYKKDDLYVHEWSLNNSSGIPVSEDYMPPFADVTTKLHISSISSWNKIAQWYSDIVRKQLKDDEVIQKTFEEIFPNGHTSLSQTERAKKIYYYITNNLNYSHVSFKQGGHVPQKPSKTIGTKLGDCKDFSALYLVLAKKAGLETKLVLILTADYGKFDLLLPSTDFNHCIVKVKIDDQYQFLELTDKYLPFKSLPMSLRGAAGLEIPYNKEDTKSYELFHFDKELRQQAIFKSDYLLEVSQGVSNIGLETRVEGHLASYYIEMFKTKKEKVLQETVQQEISDRTSVQVKSIELVDFEHNQDLGEMNYKAKLTTDLKINKVGDIYAFKTPFFLNPYNESIINSEKRSYPIDYTTYENADGYEETMTIKLGNNLKFVELPENLAYQFKEHTFSITYNLQSDTILKIKIVSQVNSETITVEEYDEFKNYINKVLDTRETLLKYKSS